MGIGDWGLGGGIIDHVGLSVLHEGTHINVLPHHGSRRTGEGHVAEIVEPGRGGDGLSHHVCFRHEFSGLDAVALRSVLLRESRCCHQQHGEDRKDAFHGLLLVFHKDRIICGKSDVQAED